MTETVMTETVMTETLPGAYIIDAVRTPVGRRGGGLATAHPADLGAHVIAALIARTQIDPSAVDDVVFGCGPDSPWNCSPRCCTRSSAPAAGGACSRCARAAARPT